MLSTRMKHAFQVLLLLLLVGYASAALARNISNTLNPAFGFDFYCFWYPVQFIRQGILPYKSDTTEFADLEAKLTFPIQHIDGATTSEYFPTVFGTQTTEAVPGNTPLYLWVVFPLGFFSWTTAKVLWLLLNMIFTLLIIFLTLSILSSFGFRLSRFRIVVISLLYLCFLATRNTIGNGQTSLLVAIFMLSAIWLSQKKQWLLAGLALGIALSKYTLALSVVILFVYRREWRILIIAVLLQIAGAVALGIVTNTSFLEVTTGYIQLVLDHADYEGIHIANYFAGNSIVVAGVVTALFALGILLSLRWKLVKLSRFQELVLFAITICWSLLFIYHRLYDLVALFFVLAFFVTMTYGSPELRFSHQITGILRLLVITSAIILCLPGTVIAPFVSAEILSGFLIAINALSTLTVVAYSLMLLTILRLHTEAQPTNETVVVGSQFFQ